MCTIRSFVAYLAGYVDILIFYFIMAATLRGSSG